jgi:hypothetical protein
MFPPETRRACGATLRLAGKRAAAAGPSALVPAAKGFACRRCGALGIAGTGCDCGPAAARAVPDLIEETVVATIRAGGRVRTVGDPPGGIAACLRSSAADGRARSAA